jgi:hypothetical protein
MPSMTAVSFIRIYGSSFIRNIDFYEEPAITFMIACHERHRAQRPRIYHNTTILIAYGQEDRSSICFPE